MIHETTIEHQHSISINNHFTGLEVRISPTPRLQVAAVSAASTGLAAALAVVPPGVSAKRREKSRRAGPNGAVEQGATPSLDLGG